MAGKWVFVPRHNLFKTEPRKGAPRTVRPRILRRRRRKTPRPGEDTAEFFQTRRAGERGAGACAAQHCPLLRTETEWFRGKSRPAPFQEFPKETEAEEAKRADAEAQRSPAEPSGHCDHPSGAAGQPWARPLLPLPSESLQQRPRVPAPGPMRMRGGGAPGLASSEPARRGAVRSLPFALQACAGGCLLPRLHCPLASPHCDVHVLSPD